MKVICISGKAQHGKDTTAAILKELLEADGKSVKIAHFADLLKFICKTYFDWDGQKDERGRHIFQYVGTDVIRAKSPDYWADFIVNFLSMFQEEWDYVLLPDCRFPNEYELFKYSGINTVLLRVERPGFVSPLTPEQQAHKSETALDGYRYDYVIQNDADLDKLRGALATFVVGLEPKFVPLTILFDADDVAENLLNCWIKLLNERYGTSVAFEDVNDWDMTLAFPTLTEQQLFGVLTEDELWKSLEPMPGSQRILQKWYDRGHKLYMVTASDYRTCKVKVERILEMFPFLDWEHIIFATNKQMVRGDILIDDGVHNLIGGAYHKILFNRPHNRGLDVEKYGIRRAETWDEVDALVEQYAKERCV